ncbi:MAG: hypothetical protein EB117_14215 [Betaproteobacteria bacterium]|nr:hypothetical protein [Betaproteobacteria bacterium]
MTISLTNQNVSPCACDWDRASSPRSNHTVVGHRTSDVLLDNPWRWYGCSYVAPRCGSETANGIPNVIVRTNDNYDYEVRTHLGAIVEVIPRTDGGTYATFGKRSEACNGKTTQVDDPTLQPVVTAPTATVIDNSGIGRNAQVTPVIDTNVHSPTFGQITSFTIDNGGELYCAYIAQSYNQTLNHLLPIGLRSDARFRPPDAVNLRYGGNIVGPPAGVAIAPSGIPGEADGPVIGTTDPLSQGLWAWPGRIHHDIRRAATTHQPPGDWTPAAAANDLEVSCEYEQKYDGFGALVAYPNKAVFPYWQVTKATTSLGSANRIEPTLTASAPDGGGAEFQVTLARTGDALPTWTVSNVAVLSAGSGYVDGASITFAGDSVEQAAAATLSANEAGEVQSVSIASGGKYFKERYANGQTLWLYDPDAPNIVKANYVPKWIPAIQPVIPGKWSQGEWGRYRYYVYSFDFYVNALTEPTVSCVTENGVLTSLTVTGGGYLVLESDTVPPIAPAVTAEIVQQLPSAGSGAEITATINTDYNSYGFGTLSLSVTKNGNGYLGASTWTEQPLVLTYHGTSQPPTLHQEHGPGDAQSAYCHDYTATGNVTDCGDLSFTARSTPAGTEPSESDATITVTPGGSFTPVFKGARHCCGQFDYPCVDEVEQVAVHFKREAAEGYSILVSDNPGKGLDGDKNYLVCPADEIEVIVDIEAEKLRFNDGSNIVLMRPGTVTLSPNTVISILPAFQCRTKCGTEITPSILDGYNSYSWAYVVVALRNVSYAGGPETAKTVTIARITSTDTYSLAPDKSCKSFPTGDWSHTTSGEIIQPNSTRTVSGYTVRQICPPYDVTVSLQ